MSVRNALPALVATSVTAGLVMAPTADAATTVSRSTAVTHTCQLVKPVALLGAKGQGTQVSPETVTASFPDRVAPGEVFTATVQPGSMKTTDGRRAGRVSYDLAFPPNATSLRAVNAGGGTGYSVAGGGAALVNMVDSAGSARPFGPFARISGGATAYFGANSATSDAVGTWNAGLTVAANTTFQLPQVALTMRAPVSQKGRTLSVGLKAAGVASGSSSVSASNTIQGAEEGGWGTERTNFYLCSSSANAAGLSATLVDDSLPTYIAGTSAVMTTPDGTRVVTGTQNTVLQARVTSEEESPTNISAGRATFTIRDARSGSVVRTVSGVPVDSAGLATTTTTFAPLTSPNITEIYTVQARYEGVTGDISASDTPPVTITVGYNEKVADIPLSSVNGVLGPNGLPVTVSGTVRFAGGAAIPAATYATLYRTDSDGSTSVVPGSRMLVPSSGAVSFPTFTLPQAQETRTYSFHAELEPQLLNGTDRYVGSTARPIAAIVTGSSGPGGVPEGGTGSVGSTDILSTPDLVWDWVRNTALTAGTFSVGFGG